MSSRAQAKAQEYRVRADDCRQRALEMQDQGAKEQLEELARHWLDLAKQMERQDGW